MHPLLKRTVALLAPLVFGICATQGLHAQDGSSFASPPPFTGDHAVIDPMRAADMNADVTDHVAAPLPERDSRSLRIEGDAAALHVVVHQATLAIVLSALATFNVRYRSSVELDEAIEGTYAGSLGRVVSRVLDGYNYATKQNGSNVEVIIFGRRGESAVPAPIIIPVLRRSSD
jgi:hypothetical protein